MHFFVALPLYFWALALASATVILWLPYELVTWLVDPLPAMGQTIIGYAVNLVLVPTLLAQGYRLLYVTSTKATAIFGCCILLYLVPFTMGVVSLTLRGTTWSGLCLTLLSAAAMGYLARIFVQASHRRKYLADIYHRQHPHQADAVAQRQTVISSGSAETVIDEERREAVA